MPLCVEKWRQRCQVVCCAASTIERAGASQNLMAAWAIIRMWNMQTGRLNSELLYTAGMRANERADWAFEVQSVRTVLNWTAKNLKDRYASIITPGNVKFVFMKSGRGQHKIYTYVLRFMFHVATANCLIFSYGYAHSKNYRATELMLARRVARD